MIGYSPDLSVRAQKSGLRTLSWKIKNLEVAFFVERVMEERATVNQAQSNYIYGLAFCPVSSSSLSQ